MGHNPTISDRAILPARLASIRRCGKSFADEFRSAPIRCEVTDDIKSKDRSEIESFDESERARKREVSCHRFRRRRVPPPVQSSEGRYQVNLNGDLSIAWVTGKSSV